MAKQINQSMLSQDKCNAFMGADTRMQLMEFAQIMENGKKRHKTGVLVRASNKRIFEALNRRSHPGTKNRMNFYYWKQLA